MTPTPAVDQHPQRGETVQPARRYHQPRVALAEDQVVEDEAGGEDHPGLESAAGAVVAVELDVEGEQQDQRDQQP